LESVPGIKGEVLFVLLSVEVNVNGNVNSNGNGVTGNLKASKKSHKA
jgi:hypothetical protein